MNRLDWTVAVAQLCGPQKGLDALHALDLPAEVRESYVWFAVAGMLERKLGNRAVADDYDQAAVASAPTPLARALIDRRLTP